MRFKREPGDGIKKEEIYEVWGDMVEHGDDTGPSIIDTIYDYLEDSYLAEFFNCKKVYANRAERYFLTLEWDDIVAHVDARPFGAHLDLYAILALRRGLLDNPDPIARIANLEGWQRRDLQAFQTVLKRAMDEALEALDEGRL